MKTIDENTTLGSLAASFTDMLITEASKKMIKQTSLPNNIIKAEIYNVMMGNLVEIRLRASINGIDFDVRDTVSLTKSDSVFRIRGNRKEEIFVSKKIMEELFSIIKMKIINILN